MQQARSPEEQFWRWRVDVQTVSNEHGYGLNLDHLGYTQQQKLQRFYEQRRSPFEAASELWRWWNSG
jgi:hypothetical protein